MFRIPENEPSITDAHIHGAVRELTRNIFPEVEINGYKYDENAIWDVLVYASANRISIKAACERLEGAPSFNWVYAFLGEQLPDIHTMKSLEKRGNDCLRASFPKGLGKKRRKLAADLVLLPYYGDEATPGLSRSQAKRSTTKFFCFASVYVIKKNKRITLCLTFVRPEDSLLEVLIRLLGRVGEIGIRPKRLCLDREFARTDVLRHLSEQPYVSVVAIPRKGKTLRGLCQGKKSLETEYTMTSAKYGQITFPLMVVCRYRMGRAGKRGVRYLLFAVLGECRSTPLRIAEEYRQRFGIETSYRIMNQARAKTTSRKAGLRLLLTLIAFILTNIWVWFKWSITLILRKKRKAQFTVTLDIFLHLVIKKIEKIYGILEVIKL